MDARINIIFVVQADCRMKARIVSGPSFCQVERIRQFIQGREVITDGNQ